MVYEIMGQIQNAVLGMIGTAGVASYALQRTPAFQKHKEYKNLKKQDKIISEAIANPTTQEQAATVSDTYIQKQADIAQKMYELKPTQKNFKSWLEAAEIAQGQAEDKVESKSTIKKKMNETRQMIQTNVNKWGEK